MQLRKRKDFPTFLEALVCAALVLGIVAVTVSITYEALERQPPRQKWSQR